MMLVRYLPSVPGKAARTVHVVPLPIDEQAAAVGALYGGVLGLDNIETVTPGEGMPCTLCLVNHMAATTPAGEQPAGGQDDADAVGLPAGGAGYQEWGWPVVLHRNQVRLSLYREVSALAIQSRCASRSQTSSPNDDARRRCSPTPTHLSTGLRSPGRDTG
jgi:hypothetical protein